MPPLTLILRQLASPLNTSAYFLANICRVTFLATKAPISLLRRPDVLEKHLLALGVGAERLLDHVDAHRAGDRIGDHQRRRGEIIGAHVGVDAALEIAVAGEHGGGHQVAIVDRLGILRRQRPGIADAGGAAEADQVEAELVEILLQAGLARDIPPTTCEPGTSEVFTQGLAARPLAAALRAKQAGADHHVRIGRVGAGGDRRDHHVAVAEIVVLAAAPARASSSRPTC